MKDYDSERLENTRIEDIIIAKLQMIIFTKKTEVLGDANYGCDVTHLLWQTNLKAEVIEAEIKQQVDYYIPELRRIPYEIRFYIIPGTIEDIGILEVDLNFTTVSAIFK